MLDILRQSTVGELVNGFSHGRLLPYLEQRSDFVVPERYRAISSPSTSFTSPTQNLKGTKTLLGTSGLPTKVQSIAEIKKIEAEKAEWQSEAPTRVPSSDALSSQQYHGSQAKSTVFDEGPAEDQPHYLPSSVRGVKLEQTDTMETAVDVESQQSRTAAALEEALEKVESGSKSEREQIGGFIVVDWYDDNDQENPRNWSFAKRSFVLFEICLLT